MTLGQKIKEARLEQKMTQKEVVGDYITRNMLSKIENDSATPSVKTLEYLAGVLGLPAGYFISDTEASEITPEEVERAREAFREKRFEQCLKLLDGLDMNGGYRDEVNLLRSRASLELAKSNIADGKFEQAKNRAEDSLYYNNESLYRSSAFRTETLLVVARCQLDIGEGFERALEAYRESYREQGLADFYRMLMAEYFLKKGDTLSAETQMNRLEKTEPVEKPELLMLKGKLNFKNANYQKAIEQLHQAERLGAHEGVQFLSVVYSLLEQCYKELDDYKMAYDYAARQLQLNKR